MRPDEIPELTDAMTGAVLLGEEAIRAIVALCRGAASCQERSELTSVWFGTIGIGLWYGLGAEAAVGMLRAMANYIEEDAEA